MITIMNSHFECKHGFLIEKYFTTAIFYPGSLDKDLTSCLWSWYRWPQCLVRSFKDNSGFCGWFTLVSDLITLSPFKLMLGSDILRDRPVGMRKKNNVKCAFFLSRNKLGRRAK